MKGPQASFLDFVLARWQAFVAAPQFAEVESAVNLDRGIGKMGIEFWCDGYIGLVGVWENGHCLDIDVLRLANGSASMLSAGPCNDADVDARFSALVPLLAHAKRGTSPRLSAVGSLTTPNKLLERTREE